MGNKGKYGTKLKPLISLMVRFVLLVKLVAIFGCDILWIFPVRQPNIDKILTTSKMATNFSFTRILHCTWPGKRSSHHAIAIFLHAHTSCIAAAVCKIRPLHHHHSFPGMTRGGVAQRGNTHPGQPRGEQQWHQRTIGGGTGQGLQQQ